MAALSALAVIEAARRAGVRLAFAESCTGGLLAAEITAVPGASDVFDRGFVSYSDEAKRGMLGVGEADLRDHGAVSEPVARAMALGARARSSAQVSLAITGIAGPGGSAHKPEGRVCFALASPEGVASETVEFGPRGREAVRRASVAHALAMILRALA